MATNAAFIYVTVNGVRADASFGLSGRGEDAGRGFSAILHLREGSNEVVVTAYGRTGISVTQELTFISDTTTPEWQRSQPRITDISIGSGFLLTEPTTVYFTVENSHLDETIITVFASARWARLPVTPHGNNRYSIVVEPNMFTAQSEGFTISAVNIWQNRDRASVWLRHGAPPALQGVLSTAPQDFISIRETARASRLWAIRFYVTETFADGRSERFASEVQIQAPNANVSGVYVFQAGHRFHGHVLRFDIRNNGANIVTFELLQN